MKVQRFKLESIRYRAGEYKCEDCGLLCIAGEVIRAEDFDAYRAKVRALCYEFQKFLVTSQIWKHCDSRTIKGLDELQAALAALEAEDD